MKLLIADDSLTQRTMLQAISSKWGFEPILAEDGQQAWDLLSQDESPQLILLDWEMPGKDGLEVCRLVRARKDANPPYILLLTARKETRDIVAGLEAGANDYIAKPFDTAELQARLRVGKRMVILQTQLHQAKEELAYQAKHDVLTGLMNRRAILEVMEQEIARVKRQEQSLYIGMCDIDHFKQINDQLGHLAGDAVLKQVAQRINQALRPYDGVGRYGGEEFLLLIHCEADMATSVFERIRLAISNKPFEFEHHSIKVSISCGVSTFHEESLKQGSTELLAAADECLYKAKQAGRNRIEFVS